MDPDQAPRNLRSILFHTQYYFLLKAGSFAWNYLCSEDIEILSILQIVQELLEGPVDTVIPDQSSNCLAVEH